MTIPRSRATQGHGSRPTLRNVAELAGVSFKTVSRVVNDERGVRPETAARVHDAVQHLGFRRNEMASSLKRGRSVGTIGLVIEDVANPFFSVIARAVEEVARDRGLLVITASSDEDRVRERQVIDSLIERRVNGLLVVPAGRDHRYLSRDVGLGTSVVFVDRPPGRLRADAVLLDNPGGARTAVRHLIQYGHRRIAILGDQLETYTLAERFAGYREALEEAGLARDPALVVFGCHDTADAERATVALLRSERPPTAIFTTNNRMSVGALQAFARLGSRTALVGFDDFELAGLLPVPATVVAYDTRKLGRRAAELLFDRMDGATGPAQRVILETWLVERGSGELRPR